MNIQKIKVSNVDHVQPVKVNNAQQIIINMDLQDKTVTPIKEQQVIKPDIDFDALSKVIVEPIPDDYSKVEGTFDITNNGEYDVKSYAGVNVDVQPNLGTKIIEKNGIYNANDDNLDGYDSVVVETSGVDINEYFDTEYNGTSPNNWLRDNFVIKTPEIIIDDSVKSLAYFGSNSNFPVKLKFNNNVTNTSYLFSNSFSKEIDLSGFDTSNVTNMQNMFSYCQNLIKIDASKFKTSNVTNMSYMLQGCNNLTELNVSGFDTSNVTNMRQLFSNCQKLEILNISNFDTGKVTLMRNMFEYCTKLQKMDLSNFDVSKVTSMQEMFYGCSELTELNLSGWQPMDTVVTSSILYNCAKLTKLIIDSPVVFPLKSTVDVNNSGITKGICNIYVPDDLIDTYKSHDVWRLYSNQIKGTSELITE